MSPLLMILINLCYKQPVPVQNILYFFELPYRRPDLGQRSSLLVNEGVE